MMRKTVVMIGVILLLGCGKATIEDYLKNGRNYLSLGDGREAEEEFLKVIEEEPSNCESNYGFLLANTLNFIEIISLISKTSSQILPQQETGTDALVESILESLVSSSLSIQQAVKVIEENACTYYHIGIPFKIGDSMFYAIGEWGLTEAELIAGVAELIAGVFHLLESMNYNFDINGLFGVVEKKYSAPEDLLEDPLELMRLVGYLPYSSPDFLTVREEREYMWTLGRDELASALFRIESAINRLFSEPREGDCIYDNILMWEDKNQDGEVGPGDVLDIKLYTYDPLDKDLVIKASERWECAGRPVYEGCLEIMEDTCFSDSLIQSFLLSIVNQQFVDKVVDLIHLFGESITGTYTEPITIGIINSLIPEGVQKGISFGDLQIPPLYVKNTVRFHIKDFFKSPVPLRDLLPYYYDEDEDGIPEFLIEMERGENADVRGFYVYKGDTSHFPEKINFIPYRDFPFSKEIKLRIKPDGIEPPDTGVLIYIALQDPSVHGLLQYNLHEIFPNWPDAWTDTRTLQNESDAQFIFNAFLADTLKTLQEILNAVIQTL